MTMNTVKCNHLTPLSLEKVKLANHTIPAIRLLLATISTGWAKKPDCF